MPVFWLATGDHDLEEVNHATLVTRHELATLRLEPEELERLRRDRGIAMSSRVGEEQPA